MAGLELGVCYYPEQWSPASWREDAQKMVDMGIDWVRIGEFTWAWVEPKSGQFQWRALDQAIEILAEAGLKIMMCTPSAAPPKWLVDRYPEILPVDEQGHVRKFGARRHYCFSSVVYRQQAVRIAQKYVTRYGAHPAIKAWQIDNEYGDHDTILSYSQAAKVGFRQWLSEHYAGDIEALNRAWGTRFWGMHYNDFDEIDLPNQLVEEPSPTHAMDFSRYSSDQVRAFNAAQVAVLREGAPEAAITHNCMAGSFDYDHYPLAADLDFVSWDSYPLGNLLGADLPLEEKQRWLRTGAPDYQSFYCDLYRGMSRGPVWITEQQPGPVNWAAHNPAPADGMVRLWSWMAYAHGVDVVCYFRWRQAPFAQEQFHTALHRTDGTPDQAYGEVRQVAQERHQIPMTERRAASIAMVMDYPSRWAARILPQGRDYSGHSVASDWYRTLRSMGYGVDIVGQQADFTRYDLVLLPDTLIVNKALVEALQNSHCKVLIGPRSGSHNDRMHSVEALAPGLLQALIPVRVTRVESLPKWHAETLTFEGQSYCIGRWRETLDTEAPVLAQYTDEYRPATPAIVRNDKACYLGVLPNGALLQAVMGSTLNWVEKQPIALPPDVRVSRRGDLGFAFNFSNKAVMLPQVAPEQILVGDLLIPPRDMVVWQLTSV